MYCEGRICFHFYGAKTKGLASICAESAGKQRLRMASPIPELLEIYELAFIYALSGVKIIAESWKVKEHGFRLLVLEIGARDVFMVADRP